MLKKHWTAAVALCLVAVSVAFFVVLRTEHKANHVLLVVFDTLRADRMSVYGYDKKTTPFLRHSEGQLLKFTQAKAAAPWTIPSHASMFTGLLPSQHRAQWGWIRLDPEFTTVAETLRDNGFRTVSIGANPFLVKNFGLTQGFTENTVIEGPADEKSAKIVARLPTVIDQTLRGEKPLFLFLNFMDTHIRYNDAEYGRHFGLHGKPPIRNAKEKWKVSAGDRAMTPDEIKDHGAAYDAAVRHLDDVVREIFELLQEKEILDQTLVILTSDHGDGLGFHQEMGHSISVWEEQLAIPLLVRFPNARRGGEVVSSPVSLVGLAPFILDNIGVNRPVHLGGTPSLEDDIGNPVCADYQSYFFDTRRQTNIEMAALYPDLKESVRPRHVLYCGPNKLVMDDLENLGFFNVEDDPNEQTNLAHVQSPGMEACLAQYRELLALGRFTPFENIGYREGLDQHQEAIELETLRALGYVQ